jgi:hypothetical protein
MQAAANKTIEPTWKRIIRSQALLAVLLVVVVNAVLSATTPLRRFDPEKLPSAHSWIWWAAQDFNAQTAPPHVVILGSSLLMNPIQEQDANFLHRDIDSVVDHRCAYLESNLKTALRTNEVGCFNFAVPGSLMSDNYMVLRSLLRGTRKPDVIVLGLALRDFIDNEVPCAAATPSYKYLSRYTDTADLVELTMPVIWQRWEYWLNQRVYLIGKKLDLQAAISQAAGQSAIDPLNPMSTNRYSQCLLNAFDMSCYVPGFRSEVERNVWITRPNQLHTFQDNSNEYKRRYRSPNASLFASQKTFLSKFCQLAQESGIRVVIVNMPVTTSHFALMPPGSYADYMHSLAEVSSRFGAPVLDLSQRGQFTDADFSDTCHMQASGGKKLLDLISSEIAAPEIARSIRVSRRASKLATFGRTIY